MKSPKTNRRGKTVLLCQPAGFHHICAGLVIVSHSLCVYATQWKFI